MLWGYDLVQNPIQKSWSLWTTIKETLSIFVASHRPLCTASFRAPVFFTFTSAASFSPWRRRSGPQPEALSWSRTLLKWSCKGRQPSHHTVWFLFFPNQIMIDFMVVCMVRLENNLMALMDLPHWLIPSLASAKYQPLCAFTRIFVAKQCLKDSTFIYCCIIGEAINFEIGRCFFQRSWLGTRKDFCKMG